jgi:site-specific recombinase XerD
MSARKQLRLVAAAASVRRRFAPHQFRHAHAIEMAHKGVPLVVIQQLGHANHGITSITCRASTARRSSTPSTGGQRR